MNTTDLMTLIFDTFLRVKGLFGYLKVRYRGLMKNTQSLAFLFALGNLLTAESQLVQPWA